jgi:hypothetical protein
MLKREDVDTYLSLHNAIDEKLAEIIGYYGDIDDNYYSILSVATDEDGFFISVEYYKWQDSNSKNFYVNKDILIDLNQFNELKERAIKAKQDRSDALEKKKNDQMQQKIKEARDFLAQHGQ